MLEHCQQEKEFVFSCTCGNINYLQTCTDCGNSVCDRCVEYHYVDAVNVKPVCKECHERGIN